MFKKAIAVLMTGVALVGGNYNNTVIAGDTPPKIVIDVSGGSVSQYYEEVEETESLPSVKEQTIKETKAPEKMAETTTATKEKETQTTQQTTATEELKPIYDVSRVQVYDRQWLYDATISDEDKEKLEKYSKKDIDSETITDGSIEIIKNFSKYLFNFNVKNYKEEKQIKEHAQKLKEYWSKPIAEIEAGLKTKVDSKIICVASEPVFEKICKNDSEIIAYGVVRRYKPKEQASHKYGRYLIKFVLKDNMVQSYEILEEVLELPRLWDSSDIQLRTRDGEIDEKGMPMYIDDLGVRSIMLLEDVVEECSYKGQPLTDEEFQKVNELVKDFYFVMNQEDIRLYIDEAQKWEMVERIRQFGYEEKWAENYVDRIIKSGEYEISSQGITAPSYAFHSSEDPNTIVVFNYNKLYMAYRAEGLPKYSRSVDEMQLEKKEHSKYGYIVKKITRKGNIL